MSIELLYTSAAAGLRQGSRGFSTVLSTAGMPANLASRLETLSGYRHVFPPQDAKADQNPVCYSHLKFNLSGRQLNVLSRIAADGVDYSGRSNKLAHHIVIDPSEQALAGPAWVLAQRGLMRDDWDGKTQTPASGPAIPSGDQSPEICNTWQTISGDAGWGGYVADALTQPTSPPLWIVFDLNQQPQLLQLINESIALLPASSRWGVTFSTYYTNLAPEIECRIRCVLAGTDEAKLAATRGHLVDLTAKSRFSFETALVKQAREGVPAATDRSTVAPEVASVPQPQGLPRGIELEEVDFALLPPTSPVPPTAPVPPIQPRRSPHASSPPGPQTKAARRTLPLLAIASAATLLVMLLTAAAYYSVKRPRAELAAAAISPKDQAVDNQLVAEKEKNEKRDKLVGRIREIEEKLKAIKLDAPLVKPDFEDFILPDVETELARVANAADLTSEINIDDTTLDEDLQQYDEDLKKSEVESALDQELVKKLRGLVDAGPDNAVETFASLKTKNQNNRKSLKKYNTDLKVHQDSIAEQLSTISEYEMQLAEIQSEFNNEPRIDASEIASAAELSQAFVKKKGYLDARKANSTPLELPDLSEPLNNLDKNVRDALAQIDRLEKLRDQNKAEIKRRQDLHREKRKLKVVVKSSSKDAYIQMTKPFLAEVPDMSNAANRRWMNSSGTDESFHSEDEDFNIGKPGQSKIVDIPLNEPEYKKHFKLTAALTGDNGGGEVTLAMNFSGEEEPPTPSSMFVKNCHKLLITLDELAHLKDKVEEGAFHKNGR